MFLGVTPPPPPPLPRLNSHLQLAGVCVKNSCQVCELKFLLDRRCRKEMVIEHVLGESSRRCELLKQMFLRTEEILHETNTRTTWSRRIRGNLHVSTKGNQRLPEPDHGLIGQFQVEICLCGRTSVCAKLFVWKCMSPVSSFSWKSSHFHVKRFAQALALKKRGKWQLRSGRKVFIRAQWPLTPALIPASVAWSD